MREQLRNKLFLVLKVSLSFSDLCKTGSKSTFCYEIKREYNYDYVLLDDLRERELSISDSESFLQIHKWPLIIDEIQYAPELFAVLESNVNKEKLEKGSNYGMYLITGSSTYELMKGVSESLAGRVSIIRMFQLSTREIFGCEECKCQ